MSPIEIVAVIFSLACVILAMRKHILNWPAGLVGVIAYFVLFYQIKLYADMGLQVIFFAQGIYGWINWVRSREGQDKVAVPIAHLSFKGRLLYSSGMLGVIAGVTVALTQFTDAVQPLWDTSAAVTSLTANWLMARRVVESWILWIVADLLYIGLFINRELYLSGGIYLIFLILASLGLVRWLPSLTSWIWNASSSCNSPWYQTMKN